MTLTSHTLASFWKNYRHLPLEIKTQATKNFRLFEDNPQHPSLHFKAVGAYWSVRISVGYRALAYRVDNDLYWFWIGPHTEYDRLLKR